MAGNRPLDLNVVLRDPGPTASGLGGRISAEILDGDDSIALAGGFESGANPSFRGRLTLELQNPTPWVDLLGAPIPPGLDQLGGLKVDGLIYLAEDRIALSDAVWETPARAGSANLALEGVGEIEQLSGSISVNRFELADLGSLIDLESLAPRSAIGTLPIDIDLSADRFGLGPIEVADATLSLAVDPPGTVSLGSDALSIFDGTLRFQLSSRLGGDVPRIAGSLQLAGVPSIPVATALGSEGLFAEGIIDASITLNGQGGSWTDLATGLAGNGFVRVRDGTLAVDGVEGNRLTVSLAGGGFDVERGRITLRELRIDGPTAALTGPVTISLPAGNAVGRLSGGLDGEERTVAVSGTLGLPFMTLLPAPQ